jgi:hypothetical protein
MGCYIYGRNPLQDFENVYEMKFSSLWTNGSNGAGGQTNGHNESHSQPLNGSVQNGHANTDEEIFSELRKPSSSTSVYEQYVKQVNVNVWCFRDSAYVCTMSLLLP